MIMGRLLVIVILTLSLAWPAAAQEHSGIPRVVDGNTIIINFQNIRLHGIEAPNAEQLCEIDGESWLCGWEATNALAHIVGRHWVSCRQNRLNEGDVVGATCFAGNVLNINAWMVRNGWATAQNQANTRFLQLETLARQERIGIWRTKYKNTEHLRHSIKESTIQVR